MDRSKEELSKLYQNYSNYYRKNNWSFEDIKFYLKKNRIDYEEYKFPEFCEKLKTDERFNLRWGSEEEISPDEKVCWNCKSIAKLIGIGQGLKCTHPSNKDKFENIPNRKYTCEFFKTPEI